MSLHETIKDDLKKAMLAKESDRVLTLRGIVSMLGNEAIAKKVTTPTLPDDVVLPVLQRAAKQRKEAAEAFRGGNRTDLAETEEKELVIIQKYLPQMMSRDEIKKIAEAKKAELGVTDKTGAGKLTGTLMKELKAKADGSDVKAVVDSLF